MVACLHLSGITGNNSTYSPVTLNGVCMTTLLLIAVFTLALVGYVAFDLNAARGYFFANPDLVEGDTPFRRWWFRRNRASLGIAGAIYLIALLPALFPEEMLALRKVRVNYDYVLYLAGALAVVGYLIFDLKTAWSYYEASPETGDEGAFLWWWTRQNIGKILVVAGIGGVALLLPHLEGFRFHLPSFEFPTSHPLVWIIAAAVGLFVSYDLKVAWDFYHVTEELVEAEVSFLRWYSRQNLLKISVAGAIVITAVSIEFIPGITDFFRKMDFSPEHPERLLLALPFVLFFAYDLKTAWEFYRDDPDLAEGEEPFFRWWARQNVDKIVIAVVLALSVLLLSFFPEVLSELRTTDFKFDRPELLLLLLPFALFIAYDLKTAHEYYQETMVGAEEEEERATFLLWWGSRNKVKIWVAVSITLGVILIMSFPAVIIPLRKAKVDLPHPKLLAIALVLALGMSGFLAFDLRTARTYYRDNLTLSTGKVSFRRWWLRVNAVKIAITLGVVFFLGLILTLDLALLYHGAGKQIAATTQASLEPQPKPADPNDKMASAQWYLKQKKFSEAGIEYRNAIQKNPDNIEAHLALARIMMVLGNMPDAYKSYQNAVLHAPTSYDAHLELGQFALGVNAGNDPDLAIHQLTLAQRLKPEAVDPPLLLAHAYARLGKNEEAIENCRIVLSREPANTSARGLLVNIYLSQRLYDAALQEAETGLKLTQDHTELSILKASAQEALGRIDAATATLLAAAGKDLKSPAPYLYLGDMQQRLKEYGAAVASYEEALKRSPNEVGAANNIAMLLTDHIIGQSGRERAYGLATRLHQIYPDNPLYADTLGWVLFTQGHIDQGLELLRRAAQQMPTELQVHYHLGAALYKKGDFAGAGRELATALGPKKDFDGADQARNMMQLLAVKGK